MYPPQFLRAIHVTRLAPQILSNHNDWCEFRVPVDEMYEYPIVVSFCWMSGTRLITPLVAISVTDPFTKLYCISFLNIRAITTPDIIQHDMLISLKKYEWSCSIFQLGKLLSWPCLCLHMSTTCVCHPRCRSNGGRGVTASVYVNRRPCNNPLFPGRWDCAFKCVNVQSNKNHGLMSWVFK